MKRRTGKQFDDGGWIRESFARKMRISADRSRLSLTGYIYIIRQGAFADKKKGKNKKGEREESKRRKRKKILNFISWKFDEISEWTLRRFTVHFIFHTLLPCVERPSVILQRSNICPAAFIKFLRNCEIRVGHKY